MRKLLFGLIFPFLFPFFGNAQGYDNTWLFGSGLSVNFTNGIIQSGGIPTPSVSSINQQYNYYLNGGTNLTSIAVSDTSGNLQFFVQYRFNNSGAPPLDNYPLKPKIFDKNGNPFPNGNIQIYTNNSGSGAPIVIPYPGKNKQYFLFYVCNNALFYSVIDISLNGGLGDVISTQKDIMLKGYGTINGIKATAVQSCEGVWLVIRSRTANEYFSFKVDENGINATPVVSPLGLLPLNDYLVSLPFYGGLLKPSNNGKYMVAATNSGVELYDFEKCSGKLKNARLIDAMQSYGVCFSPDDSKLYISHQAPYNGYYQGEIYQYDLNPPDLQSIIASKTIVMRNHLYLTIGMVSKIDTGPFGDLKLGPDGKIYVGNNNTKVPSNEPCSIIFPANHEPIPTLPANSPCLLNQRLYVIHNPNQAGVGCSAELDYLELPESHNNKTGLLLQNDIITSPSTTPNTIPGNEYSVTVCFKESDILTANENSSCRVWDDGSSELERTVYSSGIYWLRYFQDCTITTDTFHVTFIPLPKVNAQYFGCEGEIQISIQADEQLSYSYFLKDQNNILVAEASGFGEITLQDLKSGLYQLQIRNDLGCDTTLLITLNAYPPAEVYAAPEDTTIAYGTQVQLHAHGAAIYHWSPSGSLSTTETEADPWTDAVFQPTVFTVIGTNRYGCRDSAFVHINIDYTTPDLIPNAFSPNGDGLNDVFRVEGITYQKVLVFDVYNRYGQRVFWTTRSDVGWDGSFQGRPCEAGVYFYFIKVLYLDGEERGYKGDVQLIR